MDCVQSIWSNQSKYPVNYDAQWDIGYVWGSATASQYENNNFIETQNDKISYNSKDSQISSKFSEDSEYYCSSSSERSVDSVSDLSSSSMKSSFMSTENEMYLYETNIPCKDKTKCSLCCQCERKTTDTNNETLKSEIIEQNIEQNKELSNKLNNIKFNNHLIEISKKKYLKTTNEIENRKRTLKILRNLEISKHAIIDNLISKDEEEEFMHWLNIKEQYKPYNIFNRCNNELGHKNIIENEKKLKGIEKLKYNFKPNTVFPRFGNGDYNTTVISKNNKTFNIERQKQINHENYILDKKISELFKNKLKNKSKFSLYSKANDFLISKSSSKGMKTSLNEKESLEYSGSNDSTSPKSKKHSSKPDWDFGYKDYSGKDIKPIISYKNIRKKPMIINYPSHMILKNSIKETVPNNSMYVTISEDSNSSTFKHDEKD